MMAVYMSDTILCSWSFVGSGVARPSEPSFVQNNTLTFSGANPPTTPYPFSRLAWISGNNSDVIYIYHQLNNSMLAEDAYSSGSGWYSTNIGIGAND
jgi:hypothetical protein